MNQRNQRWLLIFAVGIFALSIVFFAWAAFGQGFPGCPPACGPGAMMPLPRSPYLYDYPPLRFQRRYGPGVDMPVEEPPPRYRGNELLDEFHRYRRMPVYPQRRPRWDE